MPYYNTLLFYTVGPFIIMATIFLVYKMSSDEKAAWNVAMSRLQFCIFLGYPLCSGVVFQAFNCREIMGTSYLIADLASPCYDDTWIQYSLLAIVGILVYPIGAFVYTYTCLKRNRHKLYLEVVAETSNCLLRLLFVCRKRCVTATACYSRATRQLFTIGSSQKCSESCGSRASLLSSNLAL